MRITGLHSIKVPKPVDYLDNYMDRLNQEMEHKELKASLTIDGVKVDKGCFGFIAELQNYKYTPLMHPNCLCTSIASGEAIFQLTEENLENLLRLTE